MKLIISMLFILLTLPAIANVGFTCPDLNLSIEKSDQSLIVKNLKDQTETSNPRIVLPIENTTDAYQERYGIYYSLMTEAQMHFPYMPEIILLPLMASSTKAYKAGFKAFEGEGETVKLKKMFCNALLKAIDNF